MLAVSALSTLGTQYRLPFAAQITNGNQRAFVTRLSGIPADSVNATIADPLFYSPISRARTCGELGFKSLQTDVLVTDMYADNCCERCFRTESCAAVNVLTCEQLRHSRTIADGFVFKSRPYPEPLSILKCSGDRDFYNGSTVDRATLCALSLPSPRTQDTCRRCKSLFINEEAIVPLEDCVAGVQCMATDGHCREPTFHTPCSASTADLVPCHDSATDRRLEQRPCARCVAFQLPVEGNVLGPIPKGSQCENEGNGECSIDLGLALFSGRRRCSANADSFESCGDGPHVSCTTCDCLHHIVGKSVSEFIPACTLNTPRDYGFALSHHARLVRNAETYNVSVAGETTHLRIISTVSAHPTSLTVALSGADERVYTSWAPFAPSSAEEISDLVMLEFRTSSDVVIRVECAANRLCIMDHETLSIRSDTYPCTYETECARLSVPPLFSPPPSPPLLSPDPQTPSPPKLRSPDAPSGTPPSVFEYTVRGVVVCDGEISEFSAARVRAEMSKLLDVPEQRIHVYLQASSIRVVVEVDASSQLQADSIRDAMETHLSTADKVRDVLGVVPLEPVRITVLEPTRSDHGLSTTALVLIVVGVTLALCLCVNQFVVVRVTTDPSAVHVSDSVTTRSMRHHRRPRTMP